MTRFRSITTLSFVSTTSFVLALAAAACSGSEDPEGSGGGGGTTGGTNGTTGGKPGTGGSGTAGSGTAGSGTAGSGTAGTGTAGSGTAGTGTAGTGSGGTGTAGTGAGGAPTAGTGSGGDSGGSSPTAGSAGTGTAGTDGGGAAGTAGTGGGGSDPPADLPPLVTSAQGAYWKNDVMPTEGGTAVVTVNDTMTSQTWTGFGGSFNELGWKYLSSQALQDEAIRLLFDAREGANLTWGRIPIGASDYAESRYTPDDPTADDVMAQSGEGNRPALDPQLTKFSLSRDEQKLIPYIKAAQALKSSIRFWASPWTPPPSMKSGYMTQASGSGALRPSYYDGGNMKSDTNVLATYAQYFVKFVDGYKEKGINIEIVSPQNEPGYLQNYPSCLWDATTYTTFIRDHLGPAMMAKGIGVMLGTMSNAGDSVGGMVRQDLDIANAVLADNAAKAFLVVGGAQWGVLGKINSGSKMGDLPIWATEHKCGNYPWNPDGYPAYNSTQAPNDQAYGVESWGYIRDAIKNGKVTSYSAWNMVLDKLGLGNDLSRDWKQNALLVVDGGQIKPTPYYYVFRHFAQYVAVGAKVVGVSGGDAVAFKNPDGTIVAVMFNSGAANANYGVAMGGKTFTFAMPQNGWATLKYKP